VAQKKFPERCRCGFRLDHPLVGPRLHFSAPKWVLLCFGATPYPTRVDYVCSRCGVVFDSTKDPKVLETF
jgi:DNA-directed RNA polymerase subunit RPC12/RpoP